MRGVFMVIQRNQYLKKLIDRQWNGQIKVITGIRRCGKSYLLRNLFKEYLLSRGVRSPTDPDCLEQCFQTLHFSHGRSGIIASAARSFALGLLV